MSKPNINAFFVFDANYLCPALVSVASFLETLGDQRLPLTLVYLTSDDEQANQRVALALQRFEAAMREKYQALEFQAVQLKGNLFSGYVKRLHFSNAILYKAILPQAFQHCEHILLFDCGMIFGKQLIKFIDTVRTSIAKKRIGAIAAFCEPSGQADGLRDDLRVFPHHALYPGGGTLYFDVARYTRNAIAERLIANFNDYRERLVYAEQDLLCLTLKDGELTAFAEAGLRCHIDLAAQDWQPAEEHARVHANRNCFYIKHVGSFKPWKKWVLHPSKAIFLKEKNALCRLLGAEYAELLRDDEFFPAYTGFLAQQLLLLERQYEMQKGGA